jgi:hypothetical protein
MGESGSEARRRLLDALERFDKKTQNVAWTFCLAARLLVADGNIEGATMAVGLCEERCHTTTCREHVRSLRSQIGERR